MAVGGFDFELNGVKYNAAEDAEGEHYNLGGEPLRPPNAVTIQGESSQKFQMRADTLLWTLTDWSGGEGQLKFSSRKPNRHKELNGVRVFQKPGTLRPGFYVEDTQDSTGAADLVKDGILVKGIGGLYLLDFDSNDSYLWDSGNDRWGAAVALTGVSGGAQYIDCGDENNIYWLEGGSQNVWKWDGSGSPATISTATVDSNDVWLEELGPYVYAFSPLEGRVWEIAKDGGGTTLIDDFSDDPGTKQKTQLAAMNGKIYVLVGRETETSVREIVPTTAAGTGFGAEIARLPGFQGVSIWSHSGTIFLAGAMGTSEDDVIMYLQPDGTYGTLGALRPGVDVGGLSGIQEGGQMLEHFVGINQLSDSVSDNAILEIDAVSGGMAILAINEDGDAADQSVRALAVHDGQIFFSTIESASTRRVMRAYPGAYTKASYAISPWHDFDLAEEKILSSLVLSMEALPADWRVRVDYAINGSTTWTNLIDNNTENSVGQTTVASTDSATVNFRTLAIRIRMDYTGGGIPTTCPVILGIDARAVVAQPVPVWRLLLDLSDDKSGGQGHSGAQKISNIKTAANLKKVISFKDGYSDRTPGASTEYDVVIDQYNIGLSHPGEGVATVVLKEIV